MQILTPNSEFFKPGVQAATSLLTAAGFSLSGHSDSGADSELTAPLGNDRNPTVHTPAKGRDRAFQNLRVSVSRIMYYRAKEEEPDMFPSKLYPIAGCGRVLVRGFGPQALMASPSALANYRGLFSCNQVWHCPVCADRILSGRRRELEVLRDKVRSDGKFMSMLTFSFSHGRSDKLTDLVSKLTLARTAFRNSRLWRDSFGAIRFGDVTAMEVPYGQNGWHPHLHMLVVTNSDLSLLPEAELEALRAKLSAEWLRSLEKVGLKASAEHGLHLRPKVDLVSYISKFQFELTNSAGKDEGATQHIFSLLRDGLDSGNPAKRAFALARYDEYCLALKGRPSVKWSRGLKAYAGVLDVPDEESELAEDGSPMVVLQITPHQWQFILENCLDLEALDFVEETVRARGELCRIEDPFALWLAGFGYEPPPPPPLYSDSPDSKYPGLEPLNRV